MRHPIANTFAVLCATALTAATVYGGVTLAGLGLGTGSTTYTTATTVAQAPTATNSGTSQYCPRTGCAATSCHATTGQPPGR